MRVYTSGGRATLALLGIAIAASATLFAALPASRALANGATLVVTTTADTGDGVCDGTCTLRDAVTTSNAGSGGPDFISLPAGTYTLSGAAGEDLNASGDLDITRRVGIGGAGVGATIIDGGAIEAVFDVQDSAVQLGLTLLTVRNGLTEGVLTRAAEITLSQVLLSQNADGGVVSDSGCVSANFSTIDNNGDTGIETTDGCVVLFKSTISRNGGEGGIATDSGGVNTITSTISNNNGDGVFTVDGVITLNSTTVADNIGFGVQVDVVGTGTIALNRTIIVGSEGANCSKAVASSQHSLSSDASCGLAGTGDITNGNANLGPLQNNGGDGFTQTRLPLPGSQAIDAAGSCGDESDQRGIERPVGAACDIGSVEVQGAQTPTPTLTPVTKLKTHTPTATRTAEPTHTPLPPTKTNTPAPPAPPAPTGDRAGVVRGPDTGTGGDADGGSDYAWAIVALAAGGAVAVAAGLRRRRT